MDPNPKVVSINRGKLEYEGAEIRRRGDMLNLTDMWRASKVTGSGSRPAQWLRQRETILFIRHLQDDPGVCATHTSWNNADQSAPPLIIVDRGAATWGHWHLGIAYARVLSPSFHVWCNDVVRTVMERPEFRSPRNAVSEDFWQLLQRHLEGIQKRLATSEDNQRDIMLIVSSVRQYLTEPRKEFSALSRKAMADVVKDPEGHAGRCPCCNETELFDEEDGSAKAEAQFDHWYAPSMNKPQFGWLICKPCHQWIHSSHQYRSDKADAFRSYQREVLEHIRLNRKTKAVA